MRITVDLAKASTEPVDLTGVLNPRVGDGDLKLPFHLMYNGDDYGMRGKSMDFLSEGSDQKKIYVSGTVDESTKGDDPYTGNVTFTFPTGTFKTSGAYDVDKTMFRVVNNDDHSVISTVNVKMNVLPNDSDVDSSDDVSYDSRMEKIMKDYSDKGQASLNDAKQKAQQIIDDANKQATDYLNDVKKQGEDLLDEIKQTNSEAKGNVAGDTAATATQAKQLANDNSGKIHDLQGEVGDARGRFMTLSDRENKQDFNIDRKEDKANANANYAAQDLRNDWQDKELAKKANLSFITDYLSRMRLYPEGFNDDAELKKTYSEGKPGIFVTIDTGHKWIWSNNQWNDCGPYQTSGFPRADVPISIIAYFDSHYLPKWDNNDPEGHIDFSSITGIQIRGQQSAYFTQKQLMEAFDDTPAAVVVNEKTQTVSGTDFTLIYDAVTGKLSVTKLNGLNLDGGQTVLWAHYYANNIGLLVDDALSVAYHKYSQTHQFWTAYLRGGYNLDYKVWDNDPDLYFPADIELYNPDNQYEIKKADVLAAAKAATDIVTVDDKDHIHGDTFMIQFNLNTKKVIFKKAMGGLDNNCIVLFLHHYSSVNAGMLVDTDTPILIKNFMQQHPYWTAYLAGGAKLGLALKNVNPDLYFGGDLEIYSPDNQYEVKQADILAAAKAASGIVSVDDNNHIHGDTFNIQFNLKTKQLSFKKAMGGLDDNCIVLFLHHYSSVNAGALMDYYLSQGNVGGSSNSLPSYWQTNVSDAIDRVNTNLGEAGPSGLSFLFITDQHWDGNQKKSPMLVHDVMNQTGVQLMANGGDLINQGWKPNMRAAMTSAIESVQYPGVFMATVFGNHDSNWVNVGDQHQHPERQFSHNDVYGYMMSPMVRDQNLVDDFHFVNAGQDFTYTFSVKSGDGQVWRWICADTGTDGPVNATSCQKIAELLENSANENIIIFAHIWTNNGAKTQFTQDIEKLIDARNGLNSATVSFGTFDFSKSAATSKVIMALGGHEHTDNTWTTTGGVPFILTDSDNADRSESANKQPGTVNEQCFDIFTVDPVAKQIKTVRVGRGEDRQFTIK